MYAIGEWRGEVYKPEAVDEMPENWELIRNAVLLRDRFTCTRCDKEFKRERFLSAHHLMPRRDGGSDDMTNLVTLCVPCHNYVEIMDYKTKAEIMGSWDSEPRVVKSKPQKKLSKHKESFSRPSWHSYVYGGGQKPT